MRDLSEYPKHHWPILQRLPLGLLRAMFGIVSLVVRTTAKAPGNALEIDAAAEKAFIHVVTAECNAEH